MPYPDKIGRLVSELRRALRRLHALRDIDKEVFLSDPLRNCIQCLIT